MVASSLARCAVCSLLTLPLMAEGLDFANDLRFGLTILRGPLVSEDYSNRATGVAGTYDWKNDGLIGSFGTRLELGWWHANPSFTSSWNGLWMLGVNATNFNITPDRYDTGSGSIDNDRQDLKVGYRQYGLAAGYGLATTPEPTDIGTLHYELLPIVRVGTAKAETTTTDRSPSVKSGNGLWWEAALEGALVLADYGWVFDLHAGIAYGRFSTTIDLSSTQESRMTITTLSPLIGLRVGGRF